MVYLYIKILPILNYVVSLYIFNFVLINITAADSNAVIE